ncbi:MAG TPA: hypothetical protein VGC18_06580 [Lacisediminihabitans sp.]
MGEHPGRGLVDVLGGGDELDTFGSQLGVDERVIEAVAGQPVELRDDAVGDGVGPDVLHHLVERGALVAGLG